MCGGGCVWRRLCVEEAVISSLYNFSPERKFSEFCTYISRWPTMISIANGLEPHFLLSVMPCGSLIRR